jgi:serine/threonine-protein kinase
MLDSTLGGRYRLVEIIGQGGMAVVYRAEDTLLGRQVAVKVLREELAGDPEFLGRFRSEAQSAAALTHPNIVNVYDVGADQGQQYIVMELVTGSTLKQIIQKRGPLPLSEALDLGVQICAAAEIAHRRGIVHRDLKPQNVIVNADGVAKVADFGLAQWAADLAQAGAGPSAATVLGTVHYLSPEQIQGKAATAASDIYAIGAILYEMLTGRVPFDGATPDAVAAKQVQEPPTPPRQVNERLPAAIDAFVLRALAKDPALRFPTARELGAALSSYRQLADGRTADVPRQPADRPAGRPPVTAAPLPERPPERLYIRTDPPPPPPQPVSTGRGLDWVLALLVLLALGCVAGLVPLGMTVRSVYTIPTSTPVPLVTVPNLVGLPADEAGAQLSRLGLTLVREGERFDDRVPQGRVLAQTVPSGARLAAGGGVGVVVSRGVELLESPNVVGLALSDAQSRLTAAGFSVSRQGAPSALVAAGFVSAQAPAAGSQLGRGALVTVTVSLGNKILVPDFMGRPEADAQQAIRDLGLATTFVNYQRPDEIPAGEQWRLAQVAPGCVLSQSPASGKLVDPGTTVYLAVRAP